MGKKREPRKDDDGVTVDGSHVRDLEQQFFKGMEEKISDQLKKRRSDYRKSIDAAKKAAAKREEAKLALIAQMIEEDVKQLPISTEKGNRKVFKLDTKNAIKIEKVKPKAVTVDNDQ